MLTDRRLTAAWLVALAAIACALYLPFIGNPPIFDDGRFYSGQRFSEYASSPFGLNIRQPAYFTLAVVQIIWGTMEAHRLVSLALHIACGWVLYALIRELQQCTHRAQERGARFAAFAGSALFLAHPVAVYGAAYLTQRSIVLATLFGLLSILLFLRGLRTGRYADAFSAGLLFSVAVLSKEHALLLPAAAAAGALVVRAPLRFRLRYTATYFATSAPAAVLIVLISKGIVGAPYEPEFDVVAAQLAQAAQAQSEDAVGHPWLASVLTQAVLFFRYLAAWLWPRTSAMALDLKVDFLATWSPHVALPAGLAFLGFALVAAYLLRRKGQWGMAGFGLLYFWILFLIEFAVIRFQEPFVLYRSYLWAPGLAIALAAGLGAIPLRAVLIGFLAAAPIVAVQAHDRLKTFSSRVAAWEDAAAKLPAEPIAGGWRTLYGLGREYLYAEMPDKAAQAAERCLAQYPGTYHCMMARASIHIHLQEYEAAIPYVLEAVSVRPKEGGARHHLGLILEELGCREAARQQYRISLDLGFHGAQHRLDSIDSPGSGLLPPSRIAQRAGPCRLPATRISALPPG